MKKPTPKTSWGDVAPWYDSHLEENSDTYHEKVVYPNLARILNLKKGEEFLDLACGQGFLTQKFFSFGANITGSDISKELIEIAKSRNSKIPYYVTPAHKLFFAKNYSFDKISMILAFQNISNPNEVLAEISRVIKKSGTFVLVINHPAFRIHGKSSWGYDKSTNTQYRRIDAYLSSTKNKIIMNPGSKNRVETLSYHHSLQDISKMLNKNNFAITRIEEWISHKTSQKGPKKDAEDRSRKEIPLFMMIECKPL